MKNTLLILTVISFTFSCAVSDVNRYNNGIKSLEIAHPFLSKKRISYKMWYPDGQLKYEAIYYKPDSINRTMYYYPNGKVAFETFWNNNVCDSAVKRFSDGSIEEIRTCKSDGLIVHKKSFRDYTGTLLNGKYCRYTSENCFDYLLFTGNQFKSYSYTPYHIQGEQIGKGYYYIKSDTLVLNYKTIQPYDSIKLQPLNYNTGDSVLTINVYVTIDNNEPAKGAFVQINSPTNNEKSYYERIVDNKGKAEVKISPGIDELTLNIIYFGYMPLKLKLTDYKYGHYKLSVALKSDMNTQYIDESSSRFEIKNIENNSFDLENLDINKIDFYKNKCSTYFSSHYIKNE